MFTEHSELEGIHKDHWIQLLSPKVPKSKPYDWEWFSNAPWTSAAQGCAHCAGELFHAYCPLVLTLFLTHWPSRLVRKWWVWSNTRTGNLGFLQHLDSLRYSWIDMTRPWAILSQWCCSEKGVELHVLQRFPPTKIILWSDSIDILFQLVTWLPPQNNAPVHKFG